MTAIAPPPPLHTQYAVAAWSRDGDGSVLPFVVAVALALVVHGSLAVTAQVAPAKKMSERIEMAVYTPPPPPPPPPPPLPPPMPEPPPPPRELPKPKPPETPPPSNQPPPPEPPAAPVPVVTGISMSSTVQGNTGFAVRVGNTTFGDPDKEKFVDPNAVQAYAGGSPDFKAARASQLSKEARVVQDYKGPYPRDLAEQGVEGAVVVLLEISKTGALRSSRLAKGCGNATLDKLAVEYMKRFKFSPAEVEGEKVDSILRYTYRFELYD